MSQTASPATVAVLGAGAWGTVVAWLLARNGHHVRLWSHRGAQAHAIQATRANPDYLPGLELAQRHGRPGSGPARGRGRLRGGAVARGTRPGRGAGAAGLRRARRQLHQGPRG